MNFDQILSAYKTTACILSVETYGDGRYGNIRIAAGNKPHCDEMLRVMGRPFIPDSPYEQYLPQNSNFEDFCYRSAILGQPMHSYVPLPQMGLWLNMFLLPLQAANRLRCSVTGAAVTLYPAPSMTRSSESPGALPRRSSRR